MSSGTPRAPGRVARFRRIVRAPAGRVTNQTLLVALVLVFGTGVATVAVGSASGRWVAIAHGIAGQPGLWVHIAVALVLVPLVLWHVVGRRIRPRWSDLSRRTFLRAGLLGAGAAGLYFATAGAVRLPGFPGPAGASPAPTRPGRSTRLRCRP
jgi:hypothetical protein